MKRHRMMNHKQIFIVVGIALLLLLTSCTPRSNTTESANTTDHTQASSDSQNSDASVTEYVYQEYTQIQELPDDYTKEAEHQGTLTELSYDTTLSDDSTEQKHAMVYIPYGYQEGEACNVLYLMHGYGGSYQTFLGSESKPRPIKNMLDHMIEDGKIEPLLVVTPEYSQGDTGSQNKMEALGTEIVQDLIPVVESTYTTYAKTTDRKGVEASRMHRAIGGFSMGGCATWMALAYHLDSFGYYLPMSAAMYYVEEGYDAQISKKAAKNIHNAISDDSLEDLPFFVFGASGDADFLSKGEWGQIQDLCEYEEFVYSEDSFKNGNVMFHSWPNRKHSYKYSFPYIYNGLLCFFTSEE